MFLTLQVSYLFESTYAYIMVTNLKVNNKKRDFCTKLTYENVPQKIEK